MIGSSTGDCAEETACLSEQTSESCREALNLEQTIVATGMFAVNADGEVSQCDTSNSVVDQNQCGPHGPGLCYKSSVYPACFFKVLSSAQLLENLNLLQNNDPSPKIQNTLYLIFYSDRYCDQFQGLGGIVAGTNLTATIPDIGSCREAMACFMEPLSDACLELPVARQVDMVATVNISSSSSDDDVRVTVNGTVLAPTDRCTKSLLYPQCYYRFASAADLVSNPQFYLGKSNLTENVGSSSSVAGSRHHHHVVVLFLMLLSMWVSSRKV